MFRWDNIWMEAHLYRYATPPIPNSRQHIFVRLFVYIKSPPKGVIMSPQAGWILEQEIVPRLSISVPNSVLCVGAEDPQELIQDATVIAARMLDRVERQGKLGKVSASNISYYTVKHLQTGRRANGSQTVDVFGSATQLNGSTRLHSLHEVVAQSDSGD